MRIAVLEAVAEYESARARVRGEVLEHSLERHAATTAAVQAALESAGHHVIVLPVLRDLLPRLASSGCDLVFNTYFGPGRREDQARVAALLELAGVPVTGGDATCHFVGMSKPLTKHVLRSFGLPSPRFVVCQSGSGDPAQQAAKAGLVWPLIVKTSAEGEGIGIDEASVVDGPEALQRAARRVLYAHDQPALVEEYIEGRELTVGVLDGDPPRVLPVLELVLGGHRVYSYDVKAGGLAKELCPAPLSAHTTDELADLAVQAGRAIGCRDYWRVDFRLDAENRPRVLEVNTLPGLMPGYSDLPVMSEAGGLSYAESIGVILASAVRRLEPGNSRS